MAATTVSQLQQGQTCLENGAKMLSSPVFISHSEIAQETGVEFQILTNR